MKKRLLAMLLAMVLTLGLLPAALAANDSTFDAGLTIDTDDDGNMTVTVKDSEILASQRPALSIVCTYDEAYVTYDSKVIKFSLWTGLSPSPWRQVAPTPSSRVPRLIPNPNRSPSRSGKTPSMM